MEAPLCRAILLARLLFFLGFCYSEKAPNFTFMKNATEAPEESYYDYIIVGGGTAGCPLAATLSQSSKVLLIERGGSPYGQSNITNLGSFAHTLSDTSPSSPSQRFVSEDGVVNTRARVLGGGTCLNAGFYTRASPDYVSTVGWDGDLVNESYGWVEKTAVFEPPVLQWQSAVRDGLLEAGVYPYNGYTYDHIYGTKIGGTIFDKDGHRHTAANLLEFADADGLTVLLWATVERILFKRDGRLLPGAFGVVYKDSLGVRHTAYLNSSSSKNEIILSAGALGSPQLLMLSGIGPADHLNLLGIEVVLNNPNVGQGMADNPMNSIMVPSPSPVEVSLIQVVGITRFGSFIEAASGVDFALHPSNGAQGRNFGLFSPQTGKLAIVNLVQEDQEAMSGGSAQDINNLEDSTKFRGGFILQKVMGPLSTGHLKLKSRDPEDNPSVTFNYYQDHQDLQSCIDGIRTMATVIQSKAFSRFRYPPMPLEELLNMTTSFPANFRPRLSGDTISLARFCKSTVMTIWHYHGGCQVGRVVDSEYRVIGAEALRVVDGSTFIYSPGTNPQATVMMLGRYMGVQIRRERLG